MMNQGAGMPFLWTEDEGMLLVPLPAGTSQGSAKGVNSDGWVVGTASNAYAIPFLHDGENTYRVADLLPESSGWDLAENTSSDAAAISDEGIVVGTGVYEGGPKPYALVPDNIVPLLLQEFTAEGVDAGIEVVWQLQMVDVTMDFFVERSLSMDGPWEMVTAPVSYLGQTSTLIDAEAEAGQTYYYRLLTTAGSDDLVLGYASATRIGFAGVTLGAAMPNPAPGGTQLAYRLPSSQNVQISVYDLAGRLVRTLKSGNAADGEHFVQWDGNDRRGQRVPAGVYFVNLKSALGNQTQRVVMTR
jgi:hypothetical protein